MDFANRREEAITKAKQQLRIQLTTDKILIHTWRALQNKPQALEHWLFAILPEKKPEQAKKEIATKGEKAWNPRGTGAQMDELGWETIQRVCKQQPINIEKLASTAAKNLHALLGTATTAELLEAAGGLNNLSKLTQRDILRLGNETGTFGGKQQKSILEKHELATSDRAIRILCSRTILAARLDNYKGQFKGESLRQEVLYAQ